MKVSQMMAITREKMPGMITGVHTLGFLAILGNLIGIHHESIAAKIIEFIFFLSVMIMISFSLGYMVVNWKKAIPFEILLLIVIYMSADRAVDIIALLQGFNLSEPNININIKKAYFNIFIAWTVCITAFQILIKRVGMKVRIRDNDQ
ncbi:MAG: hypothetical protein R3B39_01335 [Candidatus Paceibacterota bacterium]